MMNKIFLISTLIAFGIGLIIGVVLKHTKADLSTNMAETEKFSISSVSSTQETCSRDVPVVAPILWREGYTIAFDGRTKNPFWVQEVITKDSLSETSKHEKCTYRIDSQLPAHFRANPEDYEKTSYSQGNMVPVADKKALPSALEDSHLMSNTCPQCPHLMSGYWKTLEKSIQDLASQSDEVEVITGPLYLPNLEKDGKKFVIYQVIGQNEIAVPTHFFRVIFSRQGDSSTTLAYLIPNEPVPKNTPLNKYQVSLSDIEKASGIIFP